MRQKMKKIYYLIFLALMYSGFTKAQDKKTDNIKWREIEEAIKLNKIHPKKIMIYVYSDNCGWCKRMSNNTFSNPVIAEYLNQNFYPVKINSNIKRDITLGSHTYKFIPANKETNNPAYHEFVVSMLQGRLVYPSIAYIDEELTFMGVERGYRQAGDFEVWLHFLAENAYKENNDFDAYGAEFKGKL
jgi:thioredoxin-related protein